MRRSLLTIGGLRIFIWKPKLVWLPVCAWKFSAVAPDSVVFELIFVIFVKCERNGYHSKNSAFVSYRTCYNALNIFCDFLMLEGCFQTTHRYFLEKGFREMRICIIWAVLKWCTKRIIRICTRGQEQHPPFQHIQFPELDRFPLLSEPLISMIGYVDWKLCMVLSWNKNPVSKQKTPTYSKVSFSIKILLHLPKNSTKLTKRLK